MKMVLNELSEHSNIKKMNNKERKKHCWLKKFFECPQQINYSYVY